MDDVLDEEQIEVIRSYFLEDQSIDYDNLKKYLLSYVKEKVDGKLIIPYAMPVRKHSEKDDNLYVMVNESDLDFYF